jgi:hypothetical protein
MSLGGALLAALTLLVFLGSSGCTSDDPNVVGLSLVTDRIDTILVPLGVEEITQYSALKVVDPDVPVHRQEVLYIGERNGTRSGAMLANFDFNDIFSNEYPETLFTEENIKSIKFSLTKVNYYSSVRDTLSTGKPEDLYYEIRTIAAPFDSTEYVDYPVDPVSGEGDPLNSDYLTPTNSSEPLLRFEDFFTRDFLEYIQNEEKVGFIVTLGAESDPGLVGFASRELDHFNELDPLRVGTIPAPNFVVEFQDNTIPNFLLAPYADTGTFEQVPEPPADTENGFLLRTCLRNYPTLLFDLSDLPPNAFINRALLTVTNDTTVAFGTLGAISVLEWDVTRFGDPYKTIELDELNDPSQRYSFYVTGQNSLDPTYHTTINFDVTQAILRVVNQVYTGTRGFILTAGEDFLPTGSFSSVSPDFYYREFRFMGSAAADPEMRPQLKITYSLVDDLVEGGK